MSPPANYLPRTSLKLITKNTTTREKRVHHLFPFKVALGPLLWAQQRSLPKKIVSEYIEMEKRGVPRKLAINRVVM